MAASLVQHKSVAFSNVSSFTAQFNSATTLNNRSIGGIAMFPSTSTVSSVTDNGSTPNSYNNDNANLSNSTVGDTLNTRSANIAANPGSGNLQLSVTLSAGASGDIDIQEVSGLSTALNAVDQTGTTTHTANDTTTASVSLGSNSAGAGEWVFGVFGFETTTGGAVSAGSNTTIDDQSAGNGDAFVHRTGNSAGGATETVTVTYGNNSGYLAQLTAYKLPAAGGGSSPAPISYGYSSN